MTLKQYPRQETSSSYRLFQQVKMNVDNTVDGHESLLRLVSNNGFHLPENFIQSAESDGRIVGIGNWVIREAVRLSHVKPEMGRISVNVSPRQIDLIGVTGLEMVIKSALNYCPNAKIDVELTESCIINASKMEYLGKMLKNIGVGLHIDDFGTGYSNMACVWKSGADTVKIDGSLIRNLDDPKCGKIVEGLVRSMESVGIKIVAEGIESEDHKKRAIDIGCSSLQGYFIGMPFNCHT